jgi:uncharacterized membrane protein YgcG
MTHRRASQSPSISISPSRRHRSHRSDEEDDVDTEDDGHTSTASTGTASTASTTSTATASTATTATVNPESIFLTFMEAKFHELGRKQQLLIEREHELNLREKVLDTQMAQLHFYNGYVKGIMRGRGGAGRGGRGGGGRGGGRGRYHYQASPQNEEADPSQQQQ